MKRKITNHKTEGFRTPKKMADFEASRLVISSSIILKNQYVVDSVLLGNYGVFFLDQTILCVVLQCSSSSPHYHH